MDVERIRQFLPHRYPFVLLDRVVSVDDAEQSLRALKNVTVNEEFFQGHFPERAVMPGVLIMESLAQACGLLAYRLKGITDPAMQKNLFFYAGMDAVRFKRVVVPGDQLILDVKCIRQKKHLWKFACEATVDGDAACQAEILLAEDLS